MRKISLLCIFFLLFLASNLNAFSLSIPYVQKEEQGFIFSVMYKNFPLQGVILSLKEQKEEVLLILEVSLFERRFFLPVLFVKNLVYFKKAYFNPEDNAYRVDTEKTTLTFNSAEDAALFLVRPESYYFLFSEMLHERHYVLFRAILTYKTHLNPKLRYTSKLNTYIKNAETIYKFSKD
jgi:hypothetical protein